MDSSTGSAATGDLTADEASDLTLDFRFVVRVLPPGQYVVHIDNSQPSLTGYRPTVQGLIRSERQQHRRGRASRSRRPVNR